MDHVHLLKHICSTENLNRAFRYAFEDRTKRDYYFDYFELEYVFLNRDTILTELEEELRRPDEYESRIAYAFYPPKTELCYRRMVYIPFKDLVVRYAFVIVLADILDIELAETCFANRRAQAEAASTRLLEDFAEEGWPKFCAWQKDRIGSFNVLLRTDISSFYDSVSHDYLTQTISRELGIDADTPLMKLLGKLLRIEVISYSQLTREVTSAEEMRQGLAIGNSTEGFFANLYLKNIDDALGKIEVVEFGRYNDDMRVFSRTRQSALDSILVLQELLLTKGLNLNAAKTKIAEDEQAMEDLRSKSYEGYDYGTGEEDPDVIDSASPGTATQEKSLESEIDRPFDEFDQTFDADVEIEDSATAKNFCKFVRSDKLLPYQERTPDYLDKLYEIIQKWQGNGKHASWLIAQSAFWGGMPKETEQRAVEIIFETLRNESVDTYCKYRLLHHLIKRKKGKDKSTIRWINRLPEARINELKQILPGFLKQPAFELNIVALYTLRIIGISSCELSSLASEHIQRPYPPPIREALFYLNEPHGINEQLDLVSDEDEDEIPEPS